MSFPLPQSIPNGDSLPYWSAAAEGRLLIRSCEACGKRHFMPRRQCPYCWSENLEWIESKGEGTVYSYSVVHRAPTPAFSAKAPYVIALIDLDEGPRMFANLVGNSALDVTIGDRVRVTFEDRGDAIKMPQFVRAKG